MFAWSSALTLQAKVVLRYLKHHVTTLTKVKVSLTFEVERRKTVYLMPPPPLRFLLNCNVSKGGRVYVCYRCDALDHNMAKVMPTAVFGGQYHPLNAAHLTEWGWLQHASVGFKELKQAARRP